MKKSSAAPKISSKVASKSGELPTPKIDAPLMVVGGAKQPTQKRSRKRVNEILVAAEQMLMEMEPDDLTYSEISEKSGVPRASVYQFFPRMSDILMALTHRNSVLQEAALVASFARVKPRTIAEAVDCFVDSAAGIYNSSPAARHVCLVSGGRTRNFFDRDYNRYYSLKMAELLGDLAPPVSKHGNILEVAAMTAYSIYSLSVLREGYITQFYIEQAKRTMVFQLTSFAE